MDEYSLTWQCLLMRYFILGVYMYRTLFFDHLCMRLCVLALNLYTCTVHVYVYVYVNSIPELLSHFCGGVPG